MVGMDHSTVSPLHTKVPPVTESSPMFSMHTQLQRTTGVGRSLPREPEFHDCTVRARLDVCVERAAGTQVRVLNELAVLDDELGRRVRIAEHRSAWLILRFGAQVLVEVWVLL